jgi:hypothetical protein
MPGEQIITVHTLGGILNVRCHNIDGQQYDTIWLCGKAEFVFKGEVMLKK